MRLNGVLCGRHWSRRKGKRVDIKLSVIHQVDFFDVSYPSPRRFGENDLPIMFGSKSTSCMTILMSSPATDCCLRTVSFCSVSWLAGAGCCGCCGGCCICCCWPPSPPLRLENEFRPPRPSAADRKLLMSGLLTKTPDENSYRYRKSDHNE